MNFRAKISSGRMLYHNAETIQSYLRTIEGKEVRVGINIITKTRTLNQNAYYFGVVIKILSDEFGYLDDEMHEELKRKFNPVASRLEKGKVIGGSTRRMNTKEFEQYCEKIRIWAARDLNIMIPLPNEAAVLSEA